MLWDKKIYHKFYYWAALPPVIPKGEKSSRYSMFLRGINAEPGAWKTDAQKIAGELYIYNSNTSDSIYLDEIEIKKMKKEKE